MLSQGWHHTLVVVGTHSGTVGAVLWLAILVVLLVLVCLRLMGPRMPSPVGMVGRGAVKLRINGWAWGRPRRSGCEGSSRDENLKETETSATPVGTGLHHM
jgi:hypothetical protein